MKIFTIIKDLKWDNKPVEFSCETSGDVKNNIFTCNTNSWLTFVYPNNVYYQNPKIKDVVTHATGETLQDALDNLYKFINSADVVESENSQVVVECDYVE
jgi:hypothetical protein